MKSILSELSSERFLSQLLIEYEYDLDELASFSIKLRENDHFGGNVWISRGGKHFEWKHHSDLVAWWLISYVTNYLFHKINPRIKLKDDGLDEKLGCDFHIKYPKPIGWIQGLHSFIIRDSAHRDSIIKDFNSAYAQYLPEFWEVANR